MPTPELLRQIRRLQLRARRAVEDLLGGEYHSVFKGTGIVFEDVREYQAGDDIRSIDWNVTARMGAPFVKRFIEERELTVLLVLDQSGSQQFASRRLEKREVAAEMAAVLAFSAVGNNDKVGLIQLTDRVEKFIPPRKGSKHVLRLIREALFFKPEHTGTSLRAGLDYLNRLLRRRAIVFLFSDFLDTGYEQALRRAGKKHDLIGVRITDPREEALPPVGLLHVEDPESGRVVVLDTNDPRVRQTVARQAGERREAARQTLRSAGVDLIEVSTDGGHLEALLRFFRLRERRRGRK
jgi:uncharacterized protein (DUF58 family)